MAFRIRYRKRKLRLTITRGSARYELLDGKPLAITHYGEQVLLADKPIVLDIPPVPISFAPRQPEGRAPVPHARRVKAGEVPPAVRTNDFLHRTDGGASSQAAAAHGEANM
jgi:alpha,alpha-trehalose phosphorylase